MHRRNHPASQVIVGIVVAAFLTGESSAQEKTDWKVRFFAEAPKRWEEYLRFARCLQITTTAKVSVVPPERSVRTEYKQTKGAFLRVMYRKGEPPHIDAQKRGPMYEAEAEGANPYYSFKLKRRSPDSGWIIMDLELSDQSSDFRDKQRKRQEKIWQLAECGCLTLETLWLPMLIQDPDFKITATKPQEIDGLPVVRFDFDYPKPDKDYPIQGALPIKGGWMVLDPEHDWILREYTVRGSYPEEHYIHKTFQIRESTDRHPIVTNNTFQRTIGGKAQRVVETQWEMVEQSDVSLQEFTLSAFSLPEPPGIQVERPRWYLWIALAGIVCLSIAAMIRWVYRRAGATG